MIAWQETKKDNDALLATLLPVLHETQRDSGTLLATLLVNYKRPKDTVMLYRLPC